MSKLWQRVKDPWGGFHRRDLFRRGGLLAAAQALGGSVRAAAAPLEIGPDLYRSIGVRPMINARGTYTIITGSETLPEVKQAMDMASRSFVHMDELMDGVGQRLADLTGAEWGIVTAGCCAAVTNCTAAAIAGGNPERMQRLPNLVGLKNEVDRAGLLAQCLRPRRAHAGREAGVGARPAELERSFNDRTAMVYILAGPGTMDRWARGRSREVARATMFPWWWMPRPRSSP